MRRRNRKFPIGPGVGHGITCRVCQITSRFTWGIHRVSRADSSLVWNLGGKHNNFEKDVEFRYQHNAKIITETHNVTIITLLDNASAEEIRGQESANTSSAMMIALYTAEQPMRAEVSLSEHNLVMID